MNKKLEPIKAESLKEIFISRFEEMIFSGEFHIGEKLPSERDLARQLGVSRPVVHEGLVELAAKGLVTITPRIGTIVNDYRKYGSPALLSSLLNYQQGRIDPDLLQSLLDLRMLFELENARLAAENRTEEQMRDLKDIIKREGAIPHEKVEEITEVDFSFHHQIAIASGNMIYPLLINSFKKVYTTFTRIFFTDSTVINTVFNIHHKLAAAIIDKKGDTAVLLMEELLRHGENRLREMMQ